MGTGAAREPDERRGFSPLRCLLAEDGSGARGYALYTTADRWDEATGLPDGRLVVREVMAADPAAGAALWHSLLTRDLVTTVTAELRSPRTRCFTSCSTSAGRACRSATASGCGSSTCPPR